MRKLLIVLSVILIICSFVFVSCNKNTSADTTANVTEANATNAPTTQTTPGTASPATQAPATQAPATQALATQAPTTQAQVTDPPAPDFGEPIYRKPGTEYYLESVRIRTNNKDEDADYIVVDTSGVNAGERYADGMGYIVYYFDFSEAIEPSVLLSIRQDYKISISYDDDEYTEIANFQTLLATDPEAYEKYSSGLNEIGSYTAGANGIELTVNPYEYGYYDHIHIMIEDATMDDGWGGTINYFEIKQYKEGKDPNPVIDDTTPANPNYKDATKTYEESETVYTTSTPEEEAFIFQDNASVDGADRRFCDGTGFVVYRINIREMIEPKFKFSVGQNYLLEYSTTGKPDTWQKIESWDDVKETYEWPEGITPVYNTEGVLTSGANFHEVGFDPYEYEVYGTLYIKISHCYPGNGWGGTITGFKINTWTEVK